MPEGFAKRTSRTQLSPKFSPMPKKAAADSSKTAGPVEAHPKRAYLGQQSADFVQALLAPAVPNAALRNAFKRYRKQVEASL
jgi:hypothetical protein